MTIPTIPDNFYKFLVLLGIFLIGYALVEEKEITNSYNNKRLDFNLSIDSFTLKKLSYIHNRDKTVSKAGAIAKHHKIKNPISISDSTFAINYVYSLNDNNELALADTFNLLYQEIEDANFQLTMQDTLSDIKKDALKEAESELNDGEAKIIAPIMVLGAILLLGGAIGLMWQQNIQDEILKNQLGGKNKYYKYCQSCGRKFSSMRENGKNSDGTINIAFCVTCYSDGKFTEPDLTYIEFLKKGEDERKKMSRWKRATILTRFEKLERWNKDEYS